MGDDSGRRGGPLSWITNRTLDMVDVDEVVQNVDIDSLVQRIDMDAVLADVDVQALVDRIDPQTLVDRIDPQSLIDKVDVDVVLDRVDPQRLIDRVDAQGLLDRIDPQSLIDKVDPNRLLERVDPNQLLDRVDPDALLDRVDPNRLLDRVDPNRLLDRVDPNELLDRVDPDALLDRVDPNRLLDRVDPDPLLDRVDPDALLDRVDPNRLLDRVDADRLVERVDPNALVSRVDVDALMGRVDVVALVDRAGIADIVAESTGAVAGTVLDTARRQIVALDTIVGRGLYRLTGRDPRRRPEAPTHLAATPTQVEDGRGQVTGSYAGPLSRLLAFLIDAFVVFWAFTLASAAAYWVLGRMGYEPPVDTQWTIVGIVAFLTWCFVYWFILLMLTGRTVGKGVIGLKIVAKDGGPLTAGRAARRTLVEPLSIVTVIGLLSSLVTARRTTLHDWVGGTAEVYDWGDRPAEMPAPLTAWIQNRAVIPGSGPLHS